MANANTFNITACDNELILIAYQWGASFQLATILSGNFNSVNVTLPITAGPYQGPVTLNGVNNPLSGTFPLNLPTGDYTLAVIGIDWGGPQQFSFTFNGTTYSLPSSTEGSGVVWLGGSGVAPPNPLITFTV